MQYDQFYKTKKQHTPALNPFKQLFAGTCFTGATAGSLIKLSLIAPAILLSQLTPIYAADPATILSNKATTSSSLGIARQQEKSPSPGL